MSLDDLKKKLAQDSFGLTLDEAHAKGICIRCKRPVGAEAARWPGPDLREYQLSGHCPDCFDKTVEKADRT